jgi:hypothetical protein
MLFREIIADNYENNIKAQTRTLGEKRNYSLLKQVVHIIISALTGQVNV